MTLLEKLQAATEGSRGLDGLIARDIEGWLPYFDLDGDDLLDWPDMGGHWHQPGDLCDHSHSVSSSESGPHRDPPHYTTSIDAAFALVERVLPEFPHNGRFIWTHNEHGEIIWACTNVWNDRYVDGIAPSLPLAIIIALVKAEGE